MLYWNLVVGVICYIVIIKSFLEYIWEIEVSENKVFYLGKIFLKIGVRYIVIIYVNIEVFFFDEKLFFFK